MNHYLLNARSITHAQQLSQVLSRAGIPVRIARISKGLSKGGCGYTLQISERHFERARQVLGSAAVQPVRIIHMVNGVAQEVSI